MRCDCSALAPIRIPKKTFGENIRLEYNSMCLALASIYRDLASLQAELATKHRVMRWPTVIALAGDMAIRP